MFYSLYCSLRTIFRNYFFMRYWDVFYGLFSEVNLYALLCRSLCTIGRNKDFEGVPFSIKLTTIVSFELGHPYKFINYIIEAFVCMNKYRIKKHFKWFWYLRLLDIHMLKHMLIQTEKKKKYVLFIWKTFKHEFHYTFS